MRLKESIHIIVFVTSSAARAWVSIHKLERIEEARLFLDKVGIHQRNDDHKIICIYRSSAKTSSDQS